MTQRHILMVEDEDAMRELVRMTLEILGHYRVTAYASGAEAVRCASGQVFDLLLLDVMMPGISGVDTLAALRALPGLSHIPAVFLTSRTQARELEAYRGHNIADVIAKPFAPRLLCDRLARVLDTNTATESRHMGQPARVAASAVPDALVIEDDLSISYLVQFVLEQQGFLVRSATNGSEGREAIKNGPASRSAVVVLDITLPDEDGLQLLARLRADPRWNEVPVLVLSARRDEDTMRRAFAAGADDYLSKPFDPYQVGDRIKRLVRTPRTGRPKAPSITS